MPIELNLKAKPFNPCESIVGTELFYEFTKCQLVGSMYFCDKPPEHGCPDIAVLYHPSRWNNIKKLLQAGKWEGHFLPPFDGFAQWKKLEGKKVHTLFITDEKMYYRDLLNAAEICRYLGIDPTVEGWKKTVLHIHDIIMTNGKVKINEAGEFLTVYHPNEFQPNAEPLKFNAWKGVFGGHPEAPEAPPVEAGHVQGQAHLGPGEVLQHWHAQLQEDNNHDA